MSTEYSHKCGWFKFLMLSVALTTTMVLGMMTSFMVGYKMGASSHSHVIIKR